MASVNTPKIPNFGQILHHYCMYPSLGRQS